MSKCKHGRQSYVFEKQPVITVWSSVAGKKESEGPLGKLFDITMQDSYFGQKSWELAEKRMQQLALQEILRKKEMRNTDLDLVLSGDLLNQCIGSSFTLRNTGIPHLGLYGACSTMAESLLLGSFFVSGGYCDNVVAMTSSHFASSERQYRFPLGYGGQRTPTSQWTVTGAGAVLLNSEGRGPKVESCTIGSVTDLGIKDANDMGSAMAPAAFDTIMTHFKNTETSFDDYDLVITGDLSKVGHSVLFDLFRSKGIETDAKLSDCGLLVYNLNEQPVFSGGSGCACSMIATIASIFPKMIKGEFKRVLVAATGALHSPVMVQQKDSIPCISHCVVYERTDL